MSARLRLDLFTPLPPAMTDIANHSASLLPHLARRADLVLWTRLGFAYASADLVRALEARGLEFLDLEYDVNAFKTRLPRIRVLAIEEFDPAEFL